MKPSNMNNPLNYRVVFSLTNGGELVRSLNSKENLDSVKRQFETCTAIDQRWLIMDFVMYGKSRSCFINLNNVVSVAFIGDDE